MGDATKSLAAGIEAVLRSQIIRRRMGSDSFVEGFSEAAEEVAAHVAALQSRAFEDGARWMRERAAQTADYARERAAMALHGSCDGSDTNRTRRDLAQSLKGQILALPLQPEGERNA